MTHPFELPWSAYSAVPLLSLLLWLPALGAVAVYRLAQDDRRAYRWALGIASASLVAMAQLLLGFDDAHQGMQFAEHLGGGWLNYHLGVDGVSLLFLPLTAGLAWLALLQGYSGGQVPPYRYSAAVLAYQAVLTGLLVSQDMLLFWLFAAAETAIALRLLWRWRIGADSAMVRATQMLGAAAVLLLLAVLLLGWRQAENTGVWSFDWADLARAFNSGSNPAGEQSAVLFLLLFAVGLRMALFPLHGWLAPVLQHSGLLSVAPVFLVGVKTGVYVLLRWVVPVLPQALNHWDAYLVPVAVVGVFYGALLALVQIHLGRLLAFAVVSHSSVLLLGVLTLDREGLAGTLLMTIDTGIAGAALLLVSGQIQRRTGTVLLPRLGGLQDPLPALGLTFMVASLTLMAMPGTPGFDAAHLLLEGALEVHEWGVALALAFGTVLTAGFLLWAFQRIFLGHAHGIRHAAIAPVTVTEGVMAALLSVSLLAGFYTHPWLELIDANLPGLLRDYPAPEDR
ncbi:MAG: hypothetical protein EPN21_02675 [Methylococcaceae bacterium]|nr:MAG: hypothetical protein EPN21_02675 [Methylococcaceae bacterium]